MPTDWLIYLKVLLCLVTIASSEIWRNPYLNLTKRARSIWQKVLFTNVSLTLLIGYIFCAVPLLNFKFLSLIAILILLSHLLIAKQRKVRFDDDYKFSGNFFIDFLIVDLPVIYLVGFSLIQVILI